MKILGLDISSNCGWCLREPCEAPTFGVWKLTGSHVERADELGRRVHSLLVQHRIGRVVFEAPYIGNASAVRLLCGLCMVVEVTCQRAGVTCLETQMQTWRSHFIGTANAPKSVPRHLRRGWLKARAVEECHSRGWMVANDDEADACGLVDHACSLVSEAHRIKSTGALL